MYVCICNAISCHDIRRAVEDGVRDFNELQARTGCSDCCACCESEARKVLSQALDCQVVDFPLMPSLA